MPRLLSLAAAILAASTLAAAPAGLSAADNGVYYTATLAAPAAETRNVSGGMLWLCDGDNCIAQRSSARPLRVCRDLKRSLGTIAEFTTNGEAMDADDLAKCNA